MRSLVILLVLTGIANANGPSNGAKGNDGKSAKPVDGQSPEADGAPSKPDGLSNESPLQSSLAPTTGSLGQSPGEVAPTDPLSPNGVTNGVSPFPSGPPSILGSVFGGVHGILSAVEKMVDGILKAVGTLNGTLQKEQIGRVYKRTLNTFRQSVTEKLKETPPQEEEVLAVMRLLQTPHNSTDHLLKALHTEAPQLSHVVGSAVQTAANEFAQQQKELGQPAQQTHQQMLKESKEKVQKLLMLTQPESASNVHLVHNAKRLLSLV